MHAISSVQSILLFCVPVDHYYYTVRMLGFHITHIIHDVFSISNNPPLKCFILIVFYLIIDLLNFICIEYKHFERTQTIFYDIFNSFKFLLTLTLYYFLSLSDLSSFNFYWWIIECNGYWLISHLLFESLNFLVNSLRYNSFILAYVFLWSSDRVSAKSDLILIVGSILIGLFVSPIADLVIFVIGGFALKQQQVSYVRDNLRWLLR